MADACISNAAYIEAAKEQAAAIRWEARINAAIAAALALWQRNSSESIANMQEEIANRQVEMAERIHDHAKKFWPEENEYVDDAFNEAKHTPNYEGTAYGWKALSEDALNTGRSNWVRQMRSWCMPPSRCDDARFRRFTGMLNADTMSFAARQEETRADALNDQRYAKQYAALAMGKGLIREVAAYQTLAGSAGMSAAGALTGLINTAAGALGFAFAYRSPSEWRTGGNWGQPTATAPSYESNKLKWEPIPVPEAPPRTTSTFADPCGPSPGPNGTDEEWRRWNECKNFK